MLQIVVEDRRQITTGFGTPWTAGRPQALPVYERPLQNREGLKIDKANAIISLTGGFFTCVATGRLGGS